MQELQALRLARLCLTLLEALRPISGD